MAREKRFRMNKAIKDLVYVINKALNEWENYGVKPNDVRIAENQIEQFYNWIGREPKRNDRISSRMKYTDDQLDELKELAISLSDKKIVMEEYYSDTFLQHYENIKDKKGYSDLQEYINDFQSRYEKAAGKRGIESLDDYINLINQKEIFLQEKLIASVINYYEYKDIQEKYRRAKSKRRKPVTDDEINNFILKQYNKKGYVGNELYEFIYKNIR